MPRAEIPYGLIEPEAVKAVANGETQLTLSVAISLKRIADKLHKVPTRVETEQAAEIARLKGRIEHLEEIRPHWAKGYSGDSIAAQAATGALSSLWKQLGVRNQTDAEQMISRLMKNRERERRQNG
jgi:hypothetical protein